MNALRPPRLTSPSLRAKLLRVILLTSGAMLLAGTAIVVDGLISYRQALRDDLSVLGDILSADSAAALLFHDPQAARESLASLKTQPNIVAAALYADSGLLFASYTRADAASAAPPAAPPAAGLRFERSGLLLTRPIARDNKTIGALYLRSDLQKLLSRFEHYAAVLIVLLTGALILGLTTAAQLHALVSRPIQELSDMAKRITTGDLRARVPIRSADEIGHLASAFNQMAEELAASRESLERTVAERTRELARSNQELEQFASIASHDLQEPLRKVVSFTQLLAKDYRGRFDPDGERYIAYIVDGTTRMQALIQDLLTYSRIGKKTGRLEPVDCTDMLRETLANLALPIQESAAAVTADPLPVVTAIRLEMVQLFQNLLSNALKFRGDQPPRVRVRAERTSSAALAKDRGLPAPARAEDLWLFSVSDNGIGIEPQYADKIFMMFQRLHTRTQYPGTGIGLAICKKVVESRGGRIWVESAPGRGATFYFSIPLEIREETPATGGRTA